MREAPCNNYGASRLRCGWLLNENMNVVGIRNANESGAGRRNPRLLFVNAVKRKRLCFVIGRPLGPKITPLILGRLPPPK